MIKPLNLFYEEPDPDRWFKFDHVPRKWIRRLLRGKQRPGGVAFIAINLIKGFDKKGIPYRYNDYRYIKNHPEEIACIIGKPQVLLDKKWKNPIIFGAGIYSHPIECVNLLKMYPNIQRVLVPGEWMKQMFEPFYGDRVMAWPVGIDVNHWKPFHGKKEIDFLIYYKIRWQNQQQQEQLIDPIIQTLNDKEITYHFINYGKYNPDELRDKLKMSKAVIFLCEHETQGLAYQQVLAANTPILAWDRGGYWQDPFYYPHKVEYQPVSSVPYWDDRCGIKFKGPEDFSAQLNLFLANINGFKPRDYILENLTLEICADKYLEIYNQVADGLK